VWRDLSTGAEGGIIELVMACLNTRDFKLVCAAFDSSSFSLSKTLDGKKEKELECSKFTSFSVMPLQSRRLYVYLTKRCINTHIARQFLQEAHYSFQPREDGKYLYALAYPNDKGGYELRSEFYKGGTSPKGITTHLDQANAPVVVFEGFMDMLSWVTMTDGVKHNLVVMNSVTNREETVEVLRSISGTIYLCLDNDKAGEEATAFIKNALPSAIDYRSHYADHKDVNEFLVKHKCGI
jgi:5S rRNA maturation endonuclease (ribonuclease M5)